MDLLSKLNSTKGYCGLIKTSSYEQRINQYPSKKVYHNINNLFIDLFDPTCSILDEKDKSVYMKQRIVEIATDIDEHSKDKYVDFKYSTKLMKSSLIQTGLQTPNNLSSVIYLADLYKVSPVIYIDSIQTKVSVSQKKRDQLNLFYKDGSFMELDEPPDFKEGNYFDLKQCLVLNVKTIHVYSNHLQAIGKYKAPELIELAKQINIPVEHLGKKKVKKQLYDDINLYYLNLQ